MCVCGCVGVIASLMLDPWILMLIGIGVLAVVMGMCSLILSAHGQLLENMAQWPSSRNWARLRSWNHCDDLAFLKYSKYIIYNKSKIKYMISISVSLFYFSGSTRIIDPLWAKMSTSNITESHVLIKIKHICLDALLKNKKLWMHWFFFLIVCAKKAINQVTNYKS